MKRATHVKPISYLETNAAEIAETGEPLLITHSDEAPMAVADVSASERQAETMALLKILAIGQRDIAHGRYREADDVLADIDAPRASAAALALGGVQLKAASTR